MKYILNESQLYNTIESYLKSNYPNINRVEISGKFIGGWNDKSGFEKREIDRKSVV